MYINFKCICTSYKTIFSHYKGGCLGTTICFGALHCAWSCIL